MQGQRSIFNDKYQKNDIHLRINWVKDKSQGLKEEILKVNIRNKLIIIEKKYI